MIRSHQVCSPVRVCSATDRNGSGARWLPHLERILVLIACMVAPPAGWSASLGVVDAVVFASSRSSSRCLRPAHDGLSFAGVGFIARVILSNSTAASRLTAARSGGDKRRLTIHTPPSPQRYNNATLENYNATLTWFLLFTIVQYYSEKKPVE